jgi:hypothetical protein
MRWTIIETVFVADTTGKMIFCTSSEPSFIPSIEHVQTIQYKCGQAFVPGEIPSTNATHLYRAEPRPGTNVSSTRRCGRGHLYWVEVPTGTNASFFVFCFFSLTYLLKVLILIVIHWNIKSCGIWNVIFEIIFYIHSYVFICIILSLIVYK